VRASTSAAGSQAAMPVIVVDEENEASTGPHSDTATGRAPNTRRKRKRITGSQDVVDLVAEDTTDCAASGSAAKRPRTSDDQIGGDVIVIEDD